MGSKTINEAGEWGAKEPSVGSNVDNTLVGELFPGMPETRSETFEVSEVRTSGALWFRISSYNRKDRGARFLVGDLSGGGGMPCRKGFPQGSGCSNDERSGEEQTTHLPL